MCKALKEKYIAEYCRAQQDRIDWEKYLRGTVFDVLDIGGLLVDFDKPSIETSFCYGHGQNGVTTDEDYQRASNSAEAVRTDFDVFLTENVRDYDAMISQLKAGDAAEWVYFLAPAGCFPGAGCLVACRNYINYTEQYEQNNPKARRLTPAEIDLVLSVVEAQRANITKRCQTYWKRYGGSKLRSWAYLVD